MGGLWVDHLEAAPEERVVEFQRGATDDRPALRVDEDADAVGGLDHVVVVVGAVGERQVVGEAGAPARRYANAEDRQRAAFLQGERGDPPRGLVGDRDDLGDGSIHVLQATRPAR